MAVPHRSPFLNPRAWLWLCLSAWPPELIAWAAGWDLMDPRYLGILLLWWPLDLWARLHALRLFLGASAQVGQPYTVLPKQGLRPALTAELLLGLKSSTVALAGLVPAIALLSFGVRAWWPLAGVLALLGLLPATLYAARRLLFLVQVLKGAPDASSALAASVLQTNGKIRLFLRLAGPGLAASLLLDLSSQALPEALALLLAPLSLALSLGALVRAEKGLT